MTYITQGMLLAVDTRYQTGQTADGGDILQEITGVTVTNRGEGRRSPRNRNPLVLVAGVDGTNGVLVWVSNKADPSVVAIETNGDWALAFDGTDLSSGAVVEVPPCYWVAYTEVVGDPGNVYAN